MAKVMLEFLALFSLIWVLMYDHVPPIKVCAFASDFEFWIGVKEYYK